MTPKISEISHKTVLVRVCFDLPTLEDTARISDAKSTIQTLLGNQNKVVLISHWGRPKGQFLPEKSLQNLIPIITKIIGTNPVYLNQFEDFENAKNTIQTSDKQLFLLENTRFDPDEKSKDAQKRQILARKYATLGDFFIDEAFAVSHRKEATNYDLKELLPFTLGVSHRKEIDSLQKLKQNPDKPFMVIMAGSKLETKLDLISKMVIKADKILLAGKLAFTFLQAAKDLKIDKYSQIDFGKSEIETEFLDTAKDLLQKFPDKIILPTDFIYGDQNADLLEAYKIDKNSEYFAYDVGSKTVSEYCNILSTAKTIFWNGTLGYYEKFPFERATMLVAYFLAGQNQIYRVLGGGDTTAAMIPEILQKFDFASMGGGATLDFLGRE